MAQSETIEDLDRRAKEILSDGRPDALAVDPGAYGTGELTGHPWACLALAAVAVARDPGGDLAIDLLAAARDDFDHQRDDEGLGYWAYVAGNRYLALGLYDEASQCWTDACEALGEETPAGTHALASLSVVAYHQGDLEAGRRFAESALGLARLRIDRRSEGIALIYRGLIDLARGEFTACLTATEQADDVFGELEDLDDRYEWPIAIMLRASVHGFRGDVDEAFTVATEAIRWADEIDVAWYRGIALAVRGEFCVRRDPNQAVADSRAALEILRSVGDAWWEACALRALGVATFRSSHSEGAVRLLERAREMSPGPMEAHRSDLALAEILLAMGQREEAVALLRACDEFFAAGGAHFLQSKALSLLKLADRRNADTYRRRAKAAYLDDVAFDRLEAGLAEGTTHSLKVQCLGITEVQVDGRPVAFLTSNAERAFFMLLFANGNAAHYEELAEALWPDLPADRCRPRIRTLLWQMRKGLGDEAWRISRQGDLVQLDRSDIEVDVELAVALASRDLSSEEREALHRQLGGPVLASYQYESWAEGLVARAHSVAEALGENRSGL